MKVLASVLIAIGCLLAVPAAALAENYVVNDIGDVADAAVGSEGCDSVAGGAKQCTLRAAIQESNNSTAIDDTISFDGTLFNGDPSSDKIVIGSSFPAITDKATIDGDLNGEKAGQCEPVTGILGPCVGVEKSGGGFGLVVEADEVTIEGLAVTGALIGINVINASEDFVARDNWVGLKLDGTAGANNTGIFIDPDSNGATIGGTVATARNVIAANNNVGLDIEGADSALIQGNYFGVAPSGATAAPSPINIEVTDSTAGGGFQAEENEIGGTITLPELGTAACDGACNVISGATSTGVDLNGGGAGQNEAPATGPTTVHGNYVGLSAAGTAVLANTTYGVLSWESEDTTIGGEENGDANFFAGGGIAVYHQDGEDFAAIGNIIGSGPTGADVTPPGLGVFVYCLNLGTAGVDPVTVDGNVFRMEGGIGIEEKFGNADITTNFIQGASSGIFTTGDPPGAGNLIEDNVIGESTTNGILIENDFNLVLDNAIYGSGAAGVRIQDPTGFPILSSTGNLIGGTSAEEENTIRESGGDAIEIVDISVSEDEDSQNGVGRNKGDENTGLFIDLVDNANAGILPPAFATLRQSSASGSGVEPFATIRVFRKAEAIPGEIESFLAEATADESGNWKVTYPTIPTGTLVAATQTSPEGGTSELTIKAASADPDTKPKDPVVIGDPPCAFTAGKCRWPETVITRAPKGKTRATTVKFKFTSDMPGSTFECKLDKKPYRKCKSPKKYKRLKPGKHVFKVRATDTQGRVDPTPAKKKFRILAKRTPKG